MQCAQGFMALGEPGPFDGVWIVWGQQGSLQLHEGAEKNEEKKARTWASWKPWSGLAPKNVLKL